MADILPFLYPSINHCGIIRTQKIATVDQEMRWSFGGPNYPHGFEIWQDGGRHFIMLVKYRALFGLFDSEGVNIDPSVTLIPVGVSIDHFEYPTNRFELQQWVDFFKMLFSPMVTQEKVLTFFGVADYDKMKPVAKIEALLANGDISEVKRLLHAYHGKDDSLIEIDAVLDEEGNTDKAKRLIRRIICSRSMN